MSRAIALIESDSSDAGRVISVRGEVDVGTTPSLREWLSRASDGGRLPIVVDLRGVRFMAVSGLYVMCDEQHRMAARCARLTVVSAEPRILQLFSVCRLDDVLHLVPSRGAVPCGPWTADDAARAVRLGEWMERYSAESA